MNVKKEKIKEICDILQSDYNIDDLNSIIIDVSKKLMLLCKEKDSMDYFDKILKKLQKIGMYVFKSIKKDEEVNHDMIFNIPNEYLTKLEILTLFQVIIKKLIDSDCIFTKDYMNIINHEIAEYLIKSINPYLTTHRLFIIPIVLQNYMKLSSEDNEDED